MKTRYSLNPLVALLALSPSLVMAENSLNNIVVTANNTEQPLRTVTASMQVISREDIEARQYHTLADALKSIPGLSAYSNGGLGSATSVFMRGESAQRILVLLDGVPLNDPMNVSGAHFQNLQLDNIERIEIVKGPQSGIWGSGAVAGVIHIISRRGGQQVMVKAEKGSHNTRTLATTLGAGNQQVDFVFNLNQLTSDGFSAVKPYRQSDRDLETDGFEQTDLSFKLGLNPIKGHRLEFMARQSRATSHWDGTTDPNALFHTNYQHQQKQLQYRVNWSSLALRAFVQENQSETDYAQGKLNRFGAQLEAQLHRDHQLTLSIDKSDFQNQLNSRPNYDNNGIGLNSISQLFEQRLIINLSARADRFSAYQDKTTGALGAKFFLHEDLFIRANIASAYRAPSLAEVAYTSVGQLRPETKQGYDMGLGWRGIELSYFDSKIDQEIEYDRNAWSYSNLQGQSHYQGIEASYKQSFDAWHTDLLLNYTHLSAKNDAKQWLARRPQQQANLTIDFYGLNKTRLGIQTRYIGTTYDLANQQGPQIGEYFVTDLTADYQLSSHINLYAKVQNLFNEDYIPAVASYQADKLTPKYVYGNGGMQFFVGIKGQL
ncbi:MAG: TonB-dependent receptor [Thiomicrospira sp.]